MKKGFIFALFLIAAMTTTNAQVYLDPQAPLEQRVEDALSRMTTHEKIKVLHAQSKFTSAGVPRLGIRQLNMDDGPHGVREELEWNSWKAAGWTNDYIVAFPSLTCLAATWNRDLSALYGNAVSEEFAYRGKDIMLGPGVNIQRTPMNGRAFEYMGEDPVLAAEMVVPYIKAAQRNGVACCLKHFVLNDQEIDRFSVDVTVSERAMREIYLYPFWKAVTDANVYTIMGSYNYWHGAHCCQNGELLNGILKQEWDWDGAVVSDWGGVTNTLQAATGGMDIEMGTGTDGKIKESEFTYDDYYLGNAFEKLIEDGRLPVSVLDEKVRRVLRVIFRTAMNPRKVIGSQCSEAHYDACRQIGEEGIVLLKNQPAAGTAKKKAKDARSILPLDLSQYGRILVVGENATRSLTQGGGSSELKTLKDVSPLEAIRNAAASPTTHHPSPIIDYAQGYASGRALYNKVDKVTAEEQARLKAEALEKAKTADLIIFVGGLNKNHRQDCENGDRESYSLSFGQDELISQLAAIQKNIVVVMFGGNPYAMPWLQQVPALLHCWYLGSEAGTSLVSVLTGKTCPSGKLPVTFARRYEDYPYVKYGAEAYPGVKLPTVSEAGIASKVDYREGVFVGYRGFEKNNTAALFPFGFGLSYTSFSYGKPAISRTADGWAVAIDVTNTGSREGKEIVQLYLGEQKPAEQNPIKQLKDFVKLQLKPGETRTASFLISRSMLQTWDEQTHAWVTPAGKYRAYIGASSADIRGKADFVAD